MHPFFVFGVVGTEKGVVGVCFLELSFCVIAIFCVMESFDFFSLWIVFVILFVEFSVDFGVPVVAAWVINDR